MLRCSRWAYDLVRTPWCHSIRLAYLVLDEAALTTALLPALAPLEPAKAVNASALLSNARIRATPANPRLLDMIQALEDGAAVRDV